MHAPRSQNPKSHALACRCFLGCAVLLVLAGACDSSSKQTLVDTEKRRFTAQCSKDRVCSLSLATDQEAKASPAAPKDSTYRLHAAGRLFGVCGPLPVGSDPSPADCRALTCSSDAECPPATGLNHGVCINELCTEPSHAIQVEDAILLCLAGTGAGPRTAQQAERLALGLNCGTPCQIPKVCRQM